MLRALRDAGYETIGYADDIAIITAGKYGSIVSEVMQRALNLVEKWCATEGLSVNPKKTTVVQFTRKRGNVGTKKLVLYGETLNVVGEVKYLGVTLDRTLTFGPHIEKITTKATRALWMTRRALGAKWGLTPKLTHWIYTVMIRPIITYASFVWWPAVRTQKCRNKLTKVQRLACLGITGVKNSTPTAAMETMLDLPPLHKLVEVEAMMGAYRLWINKSVGAYRGGHGSILKQVEHHPILGMMADKTTKKYSFTKPFRIKIPSREEWKSKRSILLQGTVAYTDGSKTKERTGVGVYTLNCRLTTGLGKYATTLQTEIVAITMAVQVLLERGYVNRPLKIVTDSKGALAALASHEISSKTVWECLSVLEKLGRQNQLTLIWAPGHSDIKGNLKADKLAKKAREEPFIGPEPSCGIAYEVIKQEARNKLRSEHEKSWSLTPGLSQSKTFLEKPTFDRAKTLLNLSRIKLRKLTGLITGHCNLNKHLYNVGLSTDPTCRGCLEEDETPIHLLSYCEAYILIRKKIFGDEKIAKEKLQKIPLQKILDFFEETGVLED